MKELIESAIQNVADTIRIAAHTLNGDAVNCSTCKHYPPDPQGYCSDCYADESKFERCQRAEIKRIYETDHGDLYVEVNLCKEYNYMTRKELANEVYRLMKATTTLKSQDIWKAISETDDWSLVDEYEKLKERVKDADLQM